MFICNMPDERTDAPRAVEWTIKSRRLTPELRKAIRTASRRAGLRKGDWVADRLRTVVQNELHEGDTSLPATMDDIRREIEHIAANSRAQLQRIEELARSVSALADVVARLEARREPRATTSPITWVTDSLLWWTRFVPGFARTT
jgi:hypothetical protein